MIELDFYTVNDEAQVWINETTPPSPSPNPVFTKSGIDPSNKLLEPISTKLKPGQNTIRIQAKNTTGSAKLWVTLRDSSNQDWHVWEYGFGHGTSNYGVFLDETVTFTYNKAHDKINNKISVDTHTRQPISDQTNTYRVNLRFHTVNEKAMVIFNSDETPTSLLHHGQEPIDVPLDFAPTNNTLLLIAFKNIGSGALYAELLYGDEVVHAWKYGFGIGAPGDEEGQFFEEEVNFEYDDQLHAFKDPLTFDYVDHVVKANAANADTAWVSVPVQRGDMVNIWGNKGTAMIGGGTIPVNPGGDKTPRPTSKMLGPGQYPGALIYKIDDTVGAVGYHTIHKIMKDGELKLAINDEIKNLPQNSGQYDVTISIKNTLPT